MEARGDEVIFSTNEAEIIIDASWSHMRRYPVIGEMAQRLLDQCLVFTEEHFPVAGLETIDLTADSKDRSAARKKQDLMELMHKAARHKFGEEDGQDKPAISVNTSRSDKELILALSKDEKEIAYEELVSPLAELQEEEILENIKTYLVSTDKVEPQEALEIIDLLNDPKAAEEHRAAQLQIASKIFEVTSSIIETLESDLG